MTIVNELPTFSFAIPSFNQATQVEEMIKSVTNHNYRSVRIKDGCRLQPKTLRGLPAMSWQ